MTDSPALRYLSAADVMAAMPPLTERLDLAETALRALGDAAEMPPKIGVRPRQPGSLAHAMPALLRGEAADGSADLIGMKWIAGFPRNVALGLPAYNALTIVNDARTGLPLAVMDAGPITAQRTAAVSGAAIRLFAPPVAGRAPRVAILGAGVQGRSHLAVIGHCLPGADAAIVDVDGERASALAGEARSVAGLGSARALESVREAVESADVVVSAVSFGPGRQALDPAWLGPRALVVAVDYDMQAPATLAAEALFVVDERDQFLATRAAGPYFAGYPDPDATLGEILRAGSPPAASPPAGSARPEGRILVTHLGTGLTDVVFASAILRRAEQLGLGMLLALGSRQLDQHPPALDTHRVDGQRQLGRRIQDLAVHQREARLVERAHDRVADQEALAQVRVLVGADARPWRGYGRPRWPPAPVRPRRRRISSCPAGPRRARTGPRSASPPCPPAPL